MAQDTTRDGEPLHQFMSANRERLLAVAVEKVKTRAPDQSAEELSEGLPDVFDEIVKTLRHEAGVPDALPRPEEAATKVGRAQQRRTPNIGILAFGIGALSDSLGEVGKQDDHRFSAREYQVFNQTLDLSLATAIDEYARLERAQRREDESKRLGFIAHEMRNALTSARLAYSHLKMGTVGINSKTGDVLGRGLGAAEALVRQMLASVQLDAGVPVVRRALRVEDLFGVLKTSMVAQRGVVVSWESEPGLTLTADERLLLSAATNILQNALKFTRQGGAVAVRARRDDRWVTLEVEDECGGLPPDSEETLLAPFVQQAEDRRGLGLGLSITREAMDAQGGRLSLRNLPGRGCVFALQMPVT